MIKGIMKGLLALCCALTMVSIQGVYAAEGEPVIIDDTDERFVYSEGDANHGGWGSADGSDPAASEHWSNTPGATLEISFEGNVLEIYGIKAPNHLMLLFPSMAEKLWNVMDTDLLVPMAISCFIPARMLA